MCGFVINPAFAKASKQFDSNRPLAVILLQLLHPKTIHELCIVKRKLSRSVCACFAVNESKPRDDVTKKSRPILLYCRPWTKKRSTSLLREGTRSKGKIRGQKPFRQSNQGSRQSLFMSKTFWGLVAR